MNRFGKALVALTACLSLAACGTGGENPPAGSGSPKDEMVKIGLAQFVSHPSLDAIAQGFKDEMTDAGYIEGKNVTYDERNPQADQGSLTNIANTFAKDADIDLVVAIATPTAQAMAQVISDRPIVFGAVTDPIAAELVDSWDVPGKNITGTSDYPPIDQQISLLKEIVPDAKVIGIVYSSGEVNAEVQMNLAKAEAEKLNMTVKTVTVSNSSEVQQNAGSLTGVDAFYVGNDNTVVSGIGGVIQVAETQKVPLITADPDSVAAGATATFAINQYEMGRNTAKMAIRILEGEDPAKMPVEQQAKFAELSINKGAAARQGVTLPESVLQRAKHVHE